MTPTIRPATPDDLEAVRSLLRETWHATYDAIYGAETVERLTGEWHSIEAMKGRLARPRASFLLAEDESGLAGMAFAALEEEGILTLYQLYVRPDAQRRGIGSRLLRAVHQAFGGHSRVRVEVEPANRGAVRFYEKHGFEPLGMVRGSADGVSVIAMEMLE
ncbi:GNAT family N-acetyltransferase [Consotaella aegiceratis]|uniref:GNAT family N-acetyltransferase n=1 Tax=Consotaella aegiceratis TaxID=3097961 RepID=UPI002F42742D